LELRVIHYFLAVAKEESISRAAQSLHISQPTLSRQIKDLEDELGATLFIRGNRYITLTEEGLLFRKRAEEIIYLVDKTHSEFSIPHDMLSGDIYIGSGETEVMRFIAKIATDLRNDYPDIRYHLYSGNADDVSERLDKGLLDFGILIEPADIKKYDYIKLSAKDTWGLLMRKDSPLSKFDEIRSTDLVSIPLLTSRQTMVNNELSGWLGYDFQKLNIVATYNLVYNASLMVEQGLGYALCLDKLIHTGEQSQLCFKPLYPPLDTSLDIVWKKNQILSRAAQEFIKRIRTAK